MATQHMIVNGDGKRISGPIGSIDEMGVLLSEYQYASDGRDDWAIVEHIAA